jgi:hypothetical protein
LARFQDSTTFRLSLISRTTAVERQSIAARRGELEELFGVTRSTVYRALARTGATSPRATAAR